MNKTATILIAVAICGCSSMKDGASPNFNAGFQLEDILDGYAASGSDSQELPNYAGLKPDACLQALIDSALTRNTNLEKARQAVLAAQASLESSRLAFLPQVSLAPNAQSIRYASASTNLFSIEADANWNLSAGKVAMARMAGWELAGSRACQDAVQSDLVLELSTAYYTLCMLDSRLEIARSNRDNWQETEKALQATLDNGYSANRTQVLQARAARLEAESLILSIQENISRTENSIRSMLLLAPCPIVRAPIESIADGLDGGLCDSSVSVKSIPLSLVASRPDVEMARCQLMYSAGATGLARSYFFPQISLSGSLGWTNNAGGIELDPSEWLFNAIGQLVQPVFSAGTNRARLKQAKAQYEMALLDARQTLLDAGNSVIDAQKRIETAVAQYDIDSRRVADLEEVVRQTGLLMQHGSVNMLQVLESRRSLASALDDLVQDRFELLCGMAQLRHSLGL